MQCCPTTTGNVTPYSTQISANGTYCNVPFSGTNGIVNFKQISGGLSGTVTFAVGTTTVSADFSFP